MSIRGTTRFDDSQRLSIKGVFCVYCGEIAGTIEHFPPATVTRHGLLLPACSECNSFAGTDYCFDFYERCYHVNSRLRAKYKKFIKNPYWSEDEIKQLGYNLQKGVERWQEIKKIVMKRIAWNAISYLASIDHNNYFAEFCAKTDTIINLEKESLWNIDEIEMLKLKPFSITGLKRYLKRINNV